MKSKIILAGIVAATLVLLEAVNVFAAAPARGRYFTDWDSNGVCDYCGEGCRFVDEDGDGICDYYNNRETCAENVGKNYVDADRNGICDNYVSGRHGSHHNRGGCGGSRGCHRR